MHYHVKFCPKSPGVVQVIHSPGSESLVWSHVNTKGSTETDGVTVYPGPYKDTKIHNTTPYSVDTYVKNPRLPGYSIMGTLSDLFLSDPDPQLVTVGTGPGWSFQYPSSAQ